MIDQEEDVAVPEEGGGFKCTSVGVLLQSAASGNSSGLSHRSNQHQSKAASAFQLLLAELNSEHQQQLADLQDTYESHIAVLRCQLESNGNSSPCPMNNLQLFQQGSLSTESLEVVAAGSGIELNFGDEDYSQAEVKAAVAIQSHVRRVLAVSAVQRAKAESAQQCVDSRPEKTGSIITVRNHATEASGTRSDYAPKKHVMYNYLQEKSVKSAHNGRVTRLGEHVHDYMALKGFTSFAFSNSWKIVDIKPPGRCTKYQRMARSTIESAYFEAFCASIIFLNAIFLGIHTDYLARSQSINDVPGSLPIINRFFSVWFLAELVLRIFGHGWYGFFCSKSWVMNVFDFVIVIMDWWEILIEYVAETGDGPVFQTTVFRMLRVLRVVRAMRIVKLVQFFKEFRLMVLSVLRSGMLLIWSLALLSMIIFVYGTFLTLNVTYNLRESEDNVVLEPHQALLEDEFGTLTKACYTLFTAISGGVSWHEISDPLYQMEWAAGTVFVSYIFFTVFALLNIINGIFVDFAITSVQNDHDEVIQAQLTSDESVSKQLRDIFVQADNDGSGTLTLDEFETQLRDPRVIKHFAALGIEISEARNMFQLLDLSRSGFIGVDEFVFGCMRIKGSAKTVDLLTLMYENKRMCQLMKDCFAEIVELIEAKSAPIPVQEREERERLLAQDIREKLSSHSVNSWNLAPRLSQNSPLCPAS